MRESLSKQANPRAVARAMAFSIGFLMLISCSSQGKNSASNTRGSNVSSTTTASSTSSTSTIPPLGGRFPNASDAPDLQLTSYEGWSYILRPDLAGFDLKFQKVVSDSPPGLAKMFIVVGKPSNFPGYVVKNPSGNPGRNIPVPEARAFVVVNNVPRSGLTTDYGRAFRQTPCSTFTGDALPDFVKSQSERLFCGEIAVEGSLTTPSFEPSGLTEEVSEQSIDEFLALFPEMKIDVWIQVSGCLVVFSSGELPYVMGSPWNGPNKCAITAL